MIGEINLGGVYVHPLLVAAAGAMVLARGLEWLLSRTGAYRYIWHRGLFDVALTILLWGGLATLLSTDSLSALLHS